MTEAGVPPHPFFAGAEADKAAPKKAWGARHRRIVNELYDRDATIDTATDNDEDNEPDDTVNYSQAIIDAINELDEGEGATTSKVIEQTRLDNTEQYIETLINEGEIFEIRPGQLKVL